MTEAKTAGIGVIGAGWWATENHLPILEGHEDVELVAVCRRGEKELLEVKERFGFPIAVTDYREMFELMEGRLNGVIVSSPHYLHHEHAKAALENGCHVMIEKPMATNAKDARELVEIAHANDLEIVIPHGWNFKPYTREARRLVLEGAIGEVEHVSCQMASPRRAQYSGEGGASGALVAQNVSTYADPDRGGGYGWGQLIHALGMLFYVTELKPAEILSAMSRSRTGADLHDALAITFENGATGSVSGSAGLPSHMGYQVDLRVFGSKGVLLLDVERERLETRREDENDLIYPMESGSGSYDCVEPVEVFAGLCAGKPAQNDGPAIVGLRSVEVLEAAYR